MFCKSCLEKKVICPSEVGQRSQLLEDVAKTLTQWRACMDLNDSYKNVVENNLKPGYLCLSGKAKKTGKRCYNYCFCFDVP